MNNCQRHYKKISVLLIVSWSLILHSHAGEHFCSNNLTADIQLDALRAQAVKLTPRSEDGRSFKRCSWSLSFTGFNAPMQLVLQGDIPKDWTDGSRLELQYQLHNPDIRNQPKILQKVKPGHFNVYHVWNGTRLTVSATPSDRTLHAGSPISLTVKSAKPNYCGPEMLKFGTNCYAVSSLLQSARAAMASIDGDAQLASFRSVNEIKALMAANSARKSRYPFKRPLNLSRPVRIALFSGSDGAVAAFYSLLRNTSDCRLVQFLSAKEIRTDDPHGNCVALLVDDSDQPVLKLSNCSEPMVSLLSFPEIPSQMLSWESCTEQLNATMNEILSPKSSSDGDWSKIVIIFVCSAAVVVILLVPVIGVFVAKKKCCRRQMYSIELQAYQTS